MAGTETTAGETGFADLTYDLIALQYHALKAGHDYARYVEDAHDAGRDDIADFFEQVATDDARRAARCHQLLRDLSVSDEAGPAVD